MKPPELSPDIFQTYIWRFAYAILCGSIIGLERQLEGKTIGLRVSILVVFTTSLFVSMSTQVAQQSSDIARVMAATVSSVGFLGAGVIFREKGHASGITTASLIWILAAIGCAIGLGYLGLALSSTLAVVFVWLLSHIAEYFIPVLQRNLHTIRNSKTKSTRNR